jgi:hypothetical protein
LASFGEWEFTYDREATVAAYAKAEVGSAGFGHLYLLLKSLHSDARYREFLRKMNIPE